MNCWSCNHELIWGGDHDGEGYCNEEYNIVTNLSCPRCDAFVLVYHSPKDEEDKKPSEKKLLEPIKSLIQQ